MTTIALPPVVRVSSVSNRALKASATLWFGVAIIGQLIFAAYVTLFYGGGAGRARLDSPLAIHLLSAVILTVGGAMQLMPRIRERAPRFHRWTGRIYMVTALSTAIAGLYLLWFRGTLGDLSQHLGMTLDAILIMVFATLALRSAMARRISVHRRWALRLFMAVSGVWFFRVGLFFSLVIHRGPVGFNPDTFRGPFLTFLSFAQYLVPLAMVELYHRVQRSANAAGKLAMATALFALTVMTGIGIFAVTAGMWLPRVLKG